ncbi:hypothetical protein [Mycolicibacterium cosmeticum]|uniref:hypothetical protein n=1 Tax=Mycolicibacterium cosmeticum TaxID=258533 RepID=UPI003204A86C
MNEAQTVRRAAGLPDDQVSLDRADSALGEVLVIKVQRYLTQVSSEWDVELFFETYGRPPRDGSSWSTAIIDGLNFRTDFPDSEKQELVQESIDAAVRFLNAS